MDLNENDIQQLNELAGYLSFKDTQQFRWLMKLPHRFICEFAGNQGGKTSGVARQYAQRAMSFHPIPEKNPDYLLCDCSEKCSIIKAPEDHKCPKCGGLFSLYFNPVRTFRFASQNLPGSADGENEVKNTQYPELKKWLPPNLIKKDITARNVVLTIADIHGGPDIVVEFVSYGQQVQSTAGTQRLSIWCDEEAPPDFLEEQYPRLLAADGDMIFSMTAANKVTYMYDEYFMKAQLYLRTDNVIKAPVIKELFGDLKTVEKTASTKDIAVIQFATDDNPTLKPDAIEALFDNIDDKATLARRRYGMFAQASGRVFKHFSRPIHFISKQRYFPAGIPNEESWVHANGVDYHERVPWHYAAMSLSPNDELFIWGELRMMPDSLTTFDMANEMSHMRGDYRFLYDLIDPLANKMQVNTGQTTVEDLNRYFLMLKKSGQGTGAYWRPWDTKSIRGREQIRIRLKNSAIVGKPFCNLTPKGYLPTMWVLDTCPGVAEYLQMWRFDEHADRQAIATKDPDKESVQQKWSHYCMVIEGILKEQSFRPKMAGRKLFDRGTENRMYFNTMRAM